MDDSLSSSPSPARPVTLAYKRPTGTVVRRRTAAKQMSPGARKAFYDGSSKYTPSVRLSENSGGFSSSSSVAGDESNCDETPKSVPHRVKRRKRRKRPTTSSDENFDPERAALIDKVVEIEVALLSLQDDPNEGFARLQELAVSDKGLINDDLRRRVWPKLLNIDLIESELLPSQAEVEAHKDYNQVVLDVNRSLKRFPPGIAEEERPMLQDQLTRLIIRVLAKHPELHYYQGYHDVAITFLLVVGEQLGYHIVEKLSVGPWLREFMLPTMDRTNYLLHYMYPILHRECPELFEFLEQSEVGTIFALPWLITWFGHVLPHYVDVVRLYDFFMAQPPLMPIYLAAAIVLHKKDDVLSGDCDMASVHSQLARIPVDAPFEKLLLVSLDLYKRYPPPDLKADVDARVARLQDELVERRKRVINKYKLQPKPVPSSATNISGWTVGKVVLIAAPVVIGVLLWKYFHHSSHQGF